jgi:hypothetical protein
VVPAATSRILLEDRTMGLRSRSFPQPRLAVHAMREAARIALQTGSDDHVAALGISLDDYFNTVGMAQWRRLESRYTANDG